MNEFSKNKSHEENVKTSIDKILGTDSIIKRNRRKKEDKLKNLFINILDQLIALDIRDNELDKCFLLDLDKYNSPFYSVINSLFKLHFNEKQVELIYFYLYERITPEGHLVILTDGNGRELDLSTPEQLYEELKLIK